MSAAEIEAAVGATLDEFAAECAASGVEPLYRLHWDGDFVDDAHAAGTAAAVRARPQLTVWVYTRSLFAVAHLAGIDNLAVYVSADIDNVEAVRGVLAEHPDVLVAALGRDGGEAAKVLSLLDRRRAPICPVDTGRLPTVVAANRRGEPAAGDDGIGACAACRLCVDGLRDVRFTLRKQPWARRNLVMPDPVTIDDADGAGLLFAPRHRPQLGWWQRLDAALLDVDRTWRRLYVTYRRDGRHVASMQPRGRRLLVTVTGIGSDTAPAQLRPRDLTGIGHQMPGAIELTIDDDTTCELAAALLGAVSSPR
jgi:predicted transport protein